VPFVDWSENYNTGIPDIDREHRMLFALINDLHDRVAANSPDLSVKATIDALVEYVGYHFTREESLMASCLYTDLENHKVGHRKLQSQLETCRREFERDPEAFDMVDFMGFLAFWLQSHILQSDMAYITCVKRRVESVVGVTVKL